MSWKWCPLLGLWPDAGRSQRPEGEHREPRSAAVRSDGPLWLMVPVPHVSSTGSKNFANAAPGNPMG